LDVELLRLDVELKVEVVEQLVEEQLFVEVEELEEKDEEEL
jgi:hypothetical protein